MDLTILKKIGLTDGEIKIYKSLIKLGQSSIFNIMKKSGVSSSKVYLILDRLIQKGLVSFISENNVKKYRATNPNSVLDMIDTKKEELNDIRGEFDNLIPQIIMQMSSYEKESAQVYKGIKGLKSAYRNILGELDSKDEYCFFSVSKDEIIREDTKLFFKSFHTKRKSKKVHVRGIMDVSLKKTYKKYKIPGGLSKVKFYNLTLPIGIVIGKSRILIVIFGDISLAYELVSKRLARKFKIFFETIWKISKS